MDQLERSTLVSQVHNFTFNTYSQSVYVIQSAVFVVAASTFLPALHTNRVDFWIVASLWVLVPLTKWTRGSLLANSEFTIADFFSTYLMGMTEFALFIFLDPSHPLENAYKTEQIWYFVLAAYSASAMLLVFNRLRCGAMHTFHADLMPLGQEYRKWLKQDLGGAFLFTLLPLIVAAVANGWFSECIGWSHSVQYFANGLLGFGAIMVSVTAQQQYATIRAFLFQPSPFEQSPRYRWLAPWILSVVVAIGFVYWVATCSGDSSSGPSSATAPEALPSPNPTSATSSDDIRQAAKEIGVFLDARAQGNASLMRVYLRTCRLCDFRETALADIQRWEQPRQ